MVCVMCAPFARVVASVAWRCVRVTRQRHRGTGKNNCGAGGVHTGCVIRAGTQRPIGRKRGTRLAESEYCLVDVAILRV